MKSKSEIIALLAEALNESLDKIHVIPEKGYYNELLGPASFLLSGLLQPFVEEFEDWEPGKWIDDSLISNAYIKDGKLTLEGVMIWGRENTTEQWVDPFSFKTELHEGKVTLAGFSFMFCDMITQELAYEEFTENRDYWKGRKIKWKYKVSSETA
jgi:hypothetical protein